MAKIARQGFFLGLVNTLAQFDAAVSFYASLINPLSNASILSAEITTSYVYNDTPPASISSNVYDRLIILCRNEDNYGAITIPSPSPRTYLLTGPFRGFKVAPEDLQMGGAVATFVNLLSQTVKPDGSPFPTEEFIAALMVPQL